MVRKLVLKQILKNASFFIAIAFYLIENGLSLLRSKDVNYTTMYTFQRVYSNKSFKKSNDRLVEFTLKEPFSESFLLLSFILKQMIITSRLVKFSTIAEQKLDNLRKAVYTSVMQRSASLSQEIVTCEVCK